MAPKKLNSFMAFVQEWRQNNPEGKGMTLVQAVEPCGVLWQKMTMQQRRPYEEQAKKANLSQRGHPNDRIAQIEKAKREANERLEEINRQTENFVREAVEAKDLENAKIIFIYFNIFTRSGDIYVPAEISVVEFSLKHGIMSELNTLISPSKIDVGLEHEAHHHAQTTHMLPLPPNALGEKDCIKIYTQIRSYLRKCGGCKTISVFTTTSGIPLVRACLHFLAPENDSLDIKILGMEYLLFLLKREVSDFDKLSQFHTDAYIQKDQYEYSPNIACKFHEDIDRSNYCSKSIVKRWAFSFCSYLCGDLKIPLKPGKHSPPVKNSDKDSGERMDKESLVKLKKYPCLAGFGRGRARGRHPTLGEANP